MNVATFEASHVASQSTGPRVPACFVIMPAGNHEEYSHGPRESDFIYEAIIVPAIRNVLGDIRIVREQDKSLSGRIDADIIREVALSDYVLVDITGQNPNVFFELGIRYALRAKVTILLKQEKTVIPFDIQGFRYVTYDPLFEGRDLAIKDIQDALHAAKEGHFRVDSPVYEVFPDLEIRNLAHHDYAAPTDPQTIPAGSMEWSVYWRQLMAIVTRLHDSYREGRYKPALLIGISNGGMMFADLLGRVLYDDIPRVSLYADRRARTGHYFENDLNEGLIAGIKKFQSKQSASTFDALLCDDIIASGNSFTQARDYLAKKLPAAKVSFLPLFSRNDKYLEVIRPNFVWFHEAFKLSEADAQSVHATVHGRLPYGKDIRSA